MANVSNNDPNKKNTNTTNTAASTGAASPAVNNPEATQTASLSPEEKAYYDSIYTKGGWTQDLQESIAHGGTTTPQKYFDGSDGWYFYDQADRPYYSDNADATFMNGADYELTTRNKDEWHRLEGLKKQTSDPNVIAQLKAQQDALHAENERIRAGYGYSGGADGTMFYQIPGEKKEYTDRRFYDVSSNGNPSDTTGGTNTTPGGQNDLNALLDAWQQAALNQSNGQIDYAVAKAVADLERALQDAQPQFKEQAETVAREERQALDNSALYAEMRGDKGGIGQEQYNSIQNTAAQNHLAVQQAQTKLATDTQRQIADLRAQGEFEKADAALQITQQYLQQLIGIEQWAAEFGLSVEQFNEQVRQWEAEYNMAMQQFQTGVNQWQQEFAFQQQQYANSLNQWQQEFDYGKQSDLANVGWALLESGIPLSEEQMSAMGIDPGQASQILMQQQLESALKNNGSGTTPKTLDYDGLFKAAMESGHPQSFIANNYKEYGFTSSTGLYNDYKSWEEQPVEPSLQDLDLISVSDLGIGAMLSYNEIERMVEMGVLTTYESGDKTGVKWANGWNAAKWKASDKGLGNGGILGFQGLT